MVVDGNPVRTVFWSLGRNPVQAFVLLGLYKVCICGLLLLFLSIERLDTFAGRGRDHEWVRQVRKAQWMNWGPLVRRGSCVHKQRGPALPVDDNLASPRREAFGASSAGTTEAREGHPKGQICSVQD